MNVTNSTIKLILSNTGKIIKEGTEKTINAYSIYPDLKIISIVVAIILFFIVLLSYKNFFINKYRKLQGRYGYVKIQYTLPNRHIKDIYKKIDKNNLFTFKEKTYSMEKMSEFIYGFDKNNVPVFLYHNAFIFPLKIEQKGISKEVKDSYERSMGEKIDDKKLSAVMLQIDGNVLHTVYRRKLLSDLYTISSVDATKMKWLIIAGIVIFVIFAHYTGLLEELMTMLE